jgi:AcrR family transcriptional regulator
MDSPKAQGLRARQREGTRVAILEAAEQVFCELGLDAPMERIARQAEVAVGTLYNHFADRTALVQALFEIRRAAMITRVRAALTGTRELPFRPRLQAVVEAIIIVPPDVLRFRRLLIQESALPYKAPSTGQLEILAPLFVQGHKEGALRAAPGKLQPYFLLALVQAAIRHAVEAGNEVSLQEISDEVVQQFMAGARAGRPR